MKSANRDAAMPMSDVPSSRSRCASYGTNKKAAQKGGLMLFDYASIRSVTALITSRAASISCGSALNIATILSRWFGSK